MDRTDGKNGLLGRAAPSTGSGDGGPQKWPSAQGSTVVLSVAVLLAVFGSVGAAALTVAVLLIVPDFLGLTTIVTVALCPGARSSRVQVTRAIWRLQLPWLGKPN